MASVPMLTGTHARLLEEGLNKIWGNAHKKHSPEWQPVFEMRTSKRNYEVDQNVYGLGVAPQKDEGASYLADSGGQGYSKRYVHLTYGQEVVISKEAIEDNLYINLASQYTKFLADSLLETNEQLGVNVLNRAFDSNYVGGDGLELCSTVHKYAAGGTYANEITAVALSETSLEDMIIAISNLKDDRQINRVVMAKRLVIPPALEFQACRILKSTLQNDTANNAINAIQAKGSIPGGVHVMRRLSSTTAHFLLTDAPNGLCHFSRVPASFKNYVEDKNDNLHLNGRMRVSFGWTDAQGIYGNAGA